MLIKEIGKSIKLRRKALKITQPDLAQLAKVATDRKSTRLNSSHLRLSRMPSSA